MHEFIIKVTLTLKREQYIGNDKWQFHFKNAIKIVNCERVSFYTESTLIALQAFNIDEVERFNIEYDRKIKLDY